jgi:hypothetical protein
MQRAIQLPAMRLQRHCSLRVHASQTDTLEVRLVLFFASPVPLVELHSKLKFPNIDWTQSRSLPRRLDAEFKEQLVTSLAEHLHPNRRRPLSKRQILRWVGANAIGQQGMFSDRIAGEYRIGRSIIEENRSRTLSIAELRQKRIDVLARAVTNYVHAAREDTVSAQRDRVDCSAYAPPSIHINQPFKCKRFCTSKMISRGPQPKL